MVAKKGQVKKSGNGDTIEKINRKPVQKKAAIKDDQTAAPKEIKTDVFGNRVNTQSSLINELLLKGTKKDVIVKAIMDKFNSPEKTATGKLRGHIKHLKKEGHSVTEKDDTYTIKIKG
ncbi:MAG: hypothetical protein ABSA71_15435 [Desulfomonilia bacterium]|jgi:hypothetical protein